MIKTENAAGGLSGKSTHLVEPFTQLDFGSPGSLRLTVPLESLIDTCVFLKNELSGYLLTMVGLDDRQRSGTFLLVYVFSVQGRLVSVEAAVDPKNPVFPSLTPHYPAVHWYEREVKDLLGLIPEGHPDPRRLVLHDQWPDGIHPLRKDFDPSDLVGMEPGPKHRFHHLHGEGIVEIPVGPIHAGIIEPGHFRFAAVGEMVLHLETRLFYTHRGIEKLAEGKTFNQVLQIAERICGACALSNAVSFCQAIESIAEVEIPQRASTIRTVFLELERLYNHIGDLGNICAGVGFAVGTSQGSRLKEEMQRLNYRLSGHRFLRGTCRIGGLRRDLSLENVRDAQKTLDWVEAKFQSFIDLIMSKDSFLDRLTGTGIVSQTTALDLGAVGVAARASGIDRDARRDHPHAGYGQIAFDVPLRTQGDVRARTEIRIDEVFTSLAIIRECLDSLVGGAVFIEVDDVPPYETGVGITESPRGENVHWVRTGENGTIDRYRVRTASFCNWPIVATAVPGNMVPDFPLINKSFELCYSCLDR